MTDMNGDKMVMLSADEHNFLFNLLLDHGAKAGEREVRNQLVQKLSQPLRVRDIGPQPEREVVEPWVEVKKPVTAEDPATQPASLPLHHPKHA